MIEGTQTLDAQSLTLAQKALGRSQTLGLWQGTLALLVLGAIIGIGAASLLGSLFELPFTLWSAHVGWAAGLGAALLVLAGAVRLSMAGPPAFAPRTQRISLDEDGIRLMTDEAESLMRWPHFTRRTSTAEALILETRDQTLVLLRPADFPAVAFATVEALVARHIG